MTNSRRLAFKHLRAAADVAEANSKQAPRWSSGKFITVYPVDDTQCEQAAEDLDALVGGEDGPYILSDIRYRRGPLYLRYGGHTLITTRGDDGQPVPAVRRPDGALEPDRRRPVFCPPDWLELPAFVRDQVAALEQPGPEEFPYTVRGALHHSNGGGVYDAVDTHGKRVVLKEGRPHAATDPHGRCAATRVRHEHTILARLADEPAAAGALGCFERHGHVFLVQEHVPGRTLVAEMAARNPIVHAGHTHADRRGYRDWALDTAAQVHAAVDRLHAAGIAYGDLHPGNIICTPDGRARLIDFELAHDLDASPPPAPMGAPAYTPADGRTGAAADRYALGCLKLALFLPLTSLLALDPGKLDHHLRTAADWFDLPAAYTDSIRALVHGPAHPPGAGGSPAARRAAELADQWDTHTPGGHAAIAAAVARGTYDAADLSRTDRLFPGDIAQFTTNGYNIAHGACGVILAAPPPPHLREEILDWVEHAATTDTDGRAGFFDGAAGAAHTLRRYGRHNAAHTILDRLLRLDHTRLPSDLHSGLAGIGCHLIDEAAANPDPRLDQALARVRDTLHTRAHHAAPQAGLMHGPSGQALFWIRHYEHTADRESLTLAHTLAARDTAALRACPDGTLQVNDGRRLMPYLATGSTGVGLVLLRLLDHDPRDNYHAVIDGITRAATPTFTALAGMHNGRAGLITYLHALAHSPHPAADTAHKLAQHQTRLLACHAIAHRTAICFPGEHNLRLSTDWATGSAGILTTLHHQPVPLLYPTLPQHVRNPPNPADERTATPANQQALHSTHIRGDAR